MLLPTLTNDASVVRTIPRDAEPRIYPLLLVTANFQPEIALLAQLCSTGSNISIGSGAQYDLARWKSRLMTASISFGSKFLRARLWPKTNFTVVQYIRGRSM